MLFADQYKDKYFSILGDSVSTLDGYNPPDYAVFYDWPHKCQAQVFTPEDTWWGQVIRALGGQLLVNDSFSGSTVCKLPQYEIESYGCSDARTGGLGIGNLLPDVVMILLGINDWGRGTRIDPDYGVRGLSVFSVAYEAMLEKIRRNYPEAEIWCLMLPKSYRRQAPELVIPDRPGGRHIADYCDAIKACGEKFGCRVIDIYHPEAPYDTIDGYHPNADGMKTIANAVLYGVCGE